MLKKRMQRKVEKMTEFDNFDTFKHLDQHQINTSSTQINTSSTPMQHNPSRFNTKVSPVEAPESGSEPGRHRSRGILRCSIERREGGRSS